MKSLADVPFPFSTVPAVREFNVFSHQNLRLNSWWFFMLYRGNYRLRFEPDEKDNIAQVMHQFNVLEYDLNVRFESQT
jgi:hypothetical protein